MLWCVQVIPDDSLFPTEPLNDGLAAPRNHRGTRFPNLAIPALAPSRNNIPVSRIQDAVVGYLLEGEFSGPPTTVASDEAVHLLFSTEADARNTCNHLARQFPKIKFGWFKLEAFVEQIPPQEIQIVEKTLRDNGELTVNE
jgi:hypothetical protein